MKQTAPGADTPVFFDIEASGFDGVPIEIGWAYADLETGVIHVESHLINPPRGWTINQVWDKRAAKLHGISRQDLQTQGLPPQKIAERMNSILADCMLYADDPVWDEDWLGALYYSTTLSPSFTVHPLPASGMIDNRARENGWEGGRFSVLLKSIGEEYRTVHRAGDDARQLAALWLAASRKSPNAS